MPAVGKLIARQKAYFKNLIDNAGSPDEPVTVPLVTDGDWSKATKNVMWREYWGCASGYPRQNSLVAAEDLKWINSKLSFTRVYSETIPDLDNRGAKQKGSDYRGRWDASAMEHWVISRLMWNPYVPVEKYRDGL